MKHVRIMKHKYINYWPFNLKVTLILMNLLLCCPVLAQGVVTDDLQAMELVEGQDPLQEVDDPFESANRVIFDINMGLDKVFFRPLAQLYGEAVPDVVRDRVHHAVTNLNSPVTFINDVLQINPDRAGTTLFRFLINSTIGLAGLFDVAEKMGFEHHSEDFGQTLAAAGIDGGPYLMLPLLGPSNPRDLIGRVADFFMDPLNWIIVNNNIEWAGYTRAGTDALDRRTNSREFTDRLEEKSLDLYAKIRSLHVQSRTYRIQNEKVETTDLPEIYEDNDESTN